jgi:hypothetical protein
MEGHALLKSLMFTVGLLLILVVLVDVFLTVLYARMGAGVFSHRLACWTWHAFRGLGSPFPRHRDTIYALCGPFILVLLLGTWICGLMIGGAMVIRPGLGHGIQANQGPTPTDFVTALYVAGDALTTVGMSDLSPKTSFYRMFYTFLAVIGISMLTLTVTYLLAIYNAIKSRNTFVTKLHHATGDTGDAAELLAGLGPTGDFSNGYTHLDELGAETAELYEDHHFYAVLLYFRFAEPYYAIGRSGLVTLDLVTLIKSALDDQAYAKIKESAAVVQIWNAAMRSLTELSIVFLPEGLPQDPPPDEPTIERWRRRYRAACARLRQAGIRTMPDEAAGAEVYVSLRARWDRYILAFANHMRYTIDQIDPAGTDPTTTLQRPEFTQRLRAVG